MTPNYLVEEILYLWDNTDMTKVDIARKVLGVSTKESTVRDVIKRHRGDIKLPADKPRVEGPKILVFDIETAPMLGYFWGMWKQNISIDMQIKYSYILCWAAKWLGNPHVITASTWDDDGQTKEDDFDVVQQLADLIDEADIVVAHNGKGFDIPVLKTRMLKHNMQPLAPYKLVDTLKIAKGEFRFSSNKLDGIADFLSCGRKHQTGGFLLWKGVMDSDSESQNKMLDYNIQDVLLLEEVYGKLRAWDSRGPNAALYNSNNIVPSCPCCGSTKLVKLDKNATTNVSSFTAFRCTDCGKISRNAENTKTKEQRQNILRNVKT